MNSDGTLNVNVNRLENDNRWNAENRHRFVAPKLADSPVACVAGVFFSRSPLRQPPSIRPISSSCLEISIYFSFGMSLFSQANCMKNLRTSSLEMVRPREIIFSSGARYDEVKPNSKTLKKSCSILLPIPKRSTLGKLRCNANQY